MTFEQQSLKLFPVEHAKAILDLFDAFGVAPIGSLGNLVDLHKLLRYAGHQLETGRIMFVVRDEELAPYGAGIIFALIKILDVDVDVFGLAFGDEHRGFIRGLDLKRFPHDDVGARAPVPVHGAAFLIHLRQGITQGVAKVMNEMLADDFFLFGRNVPPLAPQRIQIHPPSSCSISGRSGNGVSGTVPGFLVFAFAMLGLKLSTIFSTLMQC